MEQDFNFRLRNSGKTQLKVWLEPWGELHIVKPGDQIHVQVRGPIGTAPNDLLEIRSDEESITLWGWARSGVTVHPE